MKRVSYVFSRVVWLPCFPSSTKNCEYKKEQHMRSPSLSDISYRSKTSYFGRVVKLPAEMEGGLFCCLLCTWMQAVWIMFGKSNITMRKHMNSIDINLECALMLLWLSISISILSDPSYFKIIETDLQNILQTLSLVRMQSILEANSHCFLSAF